MPLSGVGVPRIPKVLVVDDEETNRVLLDAVLSPEGYEVLQAASGEEALGRIANGEADLVLLDMMMPGLDGIETCERIRQHPRGLDLPVVFLTAYGDRDARIRAKRAGADEFLTKPLDEAELLVRIKNLLAAKAWHDLRERQRELLERELERRAELLLRAERLATLGTLAGAVGHELNNANMVFNFALHALEKRIEAGELPGADDLAALKRVYKTVSLHASQLLSLGRPGPDRVEMIDLAALLGELVSTLRAVGRLRQIEVLVALPEEGATVLASRTRIEQVFMNLLVNASDALSDVRDRPKTLTVRVEAMPGDRLRCVVADNGVGVEAECLERVFEPYFTTKPVGRGTGLGLPVVQQIVSAYGGTVSLESAPDRGARFTFDLPGYS
ncbi:MAG: response regulator [Myxococcales bacterium]|nr:response regulator [Myxococcales bacterium]